MSTFMNRKLIYSLLLLFLFNLSNLSAQNMRLFQSSVNPAGTCQIWNMSQNVVTGSLFYCKSTPPTTAWTVIPNTSLSSTSITIAGTTNQVNTSGCGPVSLGGTCTLSLPQSIHTGATPQFTSLGLNGIAPSAGMIIKDNAAGINPLLKLQSAGNTSGDGSTISWLSLAGTEVGTIYQDSTGGTMRMSSAGNIAFNTSQVGVSGANLRVTI